MAFSIRRRPYYVRAVLPGILVLLLTVGLQACKNSDSSPTGPSNPTSDVNLPVPVFNQALQSWCWVTAAQMVIAYRNYGLTLPQCELVEIGYGLAPGSCCNFPGACDAPGYIQQIQALVAYIGHRTSVIATSADPLTVRATLAGDNPIIAFIINSPYAQAGHFVVIRGISFDANQNATLLINDPLQFFPTQEPFAVFYPYWAQSLIIY